ncbi:hypothetical protein CANARDRAFT_201185 [[Candida] arabinofermentans NRRL YB-2248]|uniref:Gag1-like clamp domain-containing protein n=1 Tax=[Candida] arabinofermentans NRRL YB-2248 TaxID=983967 RepID=A0A1E4SXU1_9ASCO|nr:hypothetical protein CANARDRAFT_201185 [[Candida] arabinofermentans NRRL YB-2248]
MRYDSKDSQQQKTQYQISNNIISNTPPNTKTSQIATTTIDNNQLRTNNKSAISSPTKEPTKFKRTLLKFSYNCSSFFHRLKLISEACLESDQITDQLFNSSSSSSSSKQEMIKPITIVNKRNPLLDDKISNNDDHTTSTSMTSRQTTSITVPTETSPREDDNDDVQVDENTSFINGELLWEQRNAAWLEPSPENSTLEGKLKLQRRLKEQELKHHVMANHYHIVYKNLVINGKSLKKPMNLKDLIKVIEAGWNWTKVFERAAQGVA